MLVANFFHKERTRGSFHVRVEASELPEFYYVAIA